jgi:hypothetical protein
VDLVERLVWLPPFVRTRLELRFEDRWEAFDSEGQAPEEFRERLRAHPRLVGSDELPAEFLGYGVFWGHVIDKVGKVLTGPFECESCDREHPGVLCVQGQLEERGYRLRVCLLSDLFLPLTVPAGLDNALLAELNQERFNQFLGRLTEGLGALELVRHYQRLSGLEPDLVEVLDRCIQPDGLHAMPPARRTWRIRPAEAPGDPGLVVHMLLTPGKRFLPLTWEMRGRGPAPEVFLAYLEDQVPPAERHVFRTTRASGQAPLVTSDTLFEAMQHLSAGLPGYQAERV